MRKSGEMKGGDVRFKMLPTNPHVHPGINPHSIDEDGGRIGEVVAQVAAAKDNAMMKILSQKANKEREGFQGPLMLNEEGKQTILKMFSRRDKPRLEGKDMFFITQVMDDTLTPNSYTVRRERKEGGKEDVFEISWILGSDGVYEIPQEEPRTTEDYSKYNDLHIISPAELLDNLNVTTETNREDDSVDTIIESFINEEKDENLPTEDKIRKLEKEYIDNDTPPPTQPKHAESKKLADVMHEFLQHHPSPKKSAYFWVGVGKYTIGETSYEGVHIIRHPEFLEEQLNSADMEAKEAKNRLIVAKDKVRAALHKGDILTAKEMSDYYSKELTATLKGIN